MLFYGDYLTNFVFNIVNFILIMVKNKSI